MRRIQIYLVPQQSNLAAGDLKNRFTRATEILLRGFRRYQEAQNIVAKATAERQGKKAV